MTVETILLIILAGALSLGIVMFQYFRALKKNKSLYLILMFFRFLGIFAVLLLLINPKFSKEQYVLEKSNLLLLVDNSSSMADTEMIDQVKESLDALSADQGIQEKFDLGLLTFDRAVSLSDSLSFDKKSTDIHNALRTISRTYHNRNTAVVMFTDGNQTIGADYEYFNTPDQQAIFPVVIGDTTKYEDLRIEQVNLNQYAFLNNQYPLEILVRYQGEDEISVPLSITVNGTPRYRETISFSRQNNSRRINALLRANSVGTKLIRVVLGALENERNTTNNHQDLALEVIDEKTNVFIVSEIEHPDLGALKKSIESNTQRSVRVVKPSETDQEQLEEADLFILYQPNRSFEGIYELIEKRKLNYFTITGPNTDWRFLNQIQNSYQKDSYDQMEEVTPVLNSGFSKFDISDFNVDNFPPLSTTLGDLLITKPFETILDQRIKGVEIGDPLLGLLVHSSGREAVLFGENLWKWRVQNYRNNNNFESFDALIAKVVLFLTSDLSRDRLNLDYENIYRSASYAKIRATYFDETFEFDNNASISLYISGKDSEFSREMPMLLKGSFYEADLSGLPSGTFNFTVRVEADNIMRSGQFTILDFDVEKQFLTAKFNKLDRLASRTGGVSFFPDQQEELIGELVANEAFKPIQKSEQNIVSLMDFKALLALVVGAFTAEWFIRKYNGLI